MDKEQQIAENTAEIQHKKKVPGRPFVKGQSGNPKGKPKGAISLTSAIKRKLKELPPGKDKTYLEYIVSQILSRAAVDGDTQMIKTVWSYIDGMPKQSIDLSGDLRIKTLRQIAENTKKIAEEKYDEPSGDVQNQTGSSNEVQEQQGGTV